MKKPTAIKYILTFLMLGSSWLLWFSIARAVAVTDSSTWLIPITWASFFFVFASLAFVLVENINWLRGTIFLSFLGSFIFAFDWTGVAAIMFSSALAFSALIKIKKDLLLNIKVDLRKSLGAGKSFFIIALMIMITAQYYAQIRKVDAEKIIPQFNFSGKSSQLISKIISISNPQFRQIQEADLTVDEFIWENQKNQLTSLNNPEVPASISDSILETNKQKILEEGRKTLSEMTGKKIVGTEKIADVFPDVINRKVEEYFRPNAASNPALPIVPYVMAMILFLTIVPLGSFIARFLIYLVFGIFILLVRTDVIRVAKVMMEVERIRE